MVTQTLSLTLSRKIQRALSMVVATGLIAGTVISAQSQPAAAAPTGNSVTLKPNPAYSSEEFQGWGTSLVWFANATGGYPEALREELYQLVFGKDGLNLNIARYNIGGGNASDVTDYLRAGGAVDGYWKADPSGTLYGTTTNYADREALRQVWDPSNPDHYNWEADRTQRWWVERLAADNQISHWETFSNSPPYFMTESGYVSGGFNSNHEQIRPDSAGNFVAYLTAVTERLEDTYGIKVDTIDPFNEPNTNYWGTTLNGSNQPTGGRQEGAHVGPDRQQDVIDALHARLNQTGTSTKAVISAMDETNPSRFAANWNAYSAEAKSKVSQLNVHTYGTSDRLTVRDQAKVADRPLWMSEIEGSWVTGYDPVDMRNGLGMAERVMSDLRELESSAWVLWQPVEDLYNMQPQGENLNWGSILLDFDCTYYAEAGAQVFKSKRRVDDAGGDSTKVPECGIETNSKFNTLRNFTHFISEGDHMIAVNDELTTAAVTSDGTGVTLVHSNESASSQQVVVDLSNFGEIQPGATITPYVTSEATAADPQSNALVQGDTVSIDPASKSVAITVPGQSVTSFVVTGVSGVAEQAPTLKDSDSYQLIGLQSGKALTAASGAHATTITSPATEQAALNSQTWTAHAVPVGKQTQTKRFVLTSGDGKALGATDAGTDLRTMTVAEAQSNPETVWILNTTNGTTFSFVNSSVSKALEVGGQASTENAPVGIYGSNGGDNQSWELRNVTAVGTQPVDIWTRTGVEPVLPAKVVPIYDWGNGAPINVTWDPIPAVAWQTAGAFTVQGNATDLYNTKLTATALVDVGDLTIADSVSLTTHAGTTKAAVKSAAPSKVPARVGASNATFETAVTWDWSTCTDDSFASPGTVTIAGQAESGTPGATIPASLIVIVTPAVLTNVAPLDSTTASATFTEGNYGVDRTRNRVTTDKGWSNWKSGSKNTSDTLSYTFEKSRSLDEVKVYFYKDGTTSWAQAIRFEYLDATNNWKPVPGFESPVTVASPSDGSAPIVNADLAGVDAGALRVVMDAHANTHLIVSEVEIYAAQAEIASLASLSSLRADGVQLSDFAPGIADYSVQSAGSRFPEISAIPADRNAQVQITQATIENDGRASVRVTAADGATEQVYTVTINRNIALTAIWLSGDAKVGGKVHANVRVDPSDATIAYQWHLDGTPISGATSQDYFPVQADQGKALSVSALGTAPGYGPSTEIISESATIKSIDSPGEELGPKLVLSTTTVGAGEQVGITATGYSANGSLEVMLHSTPVLLGQMTTNTKGDGSISVQIPPSTAPGEHTIVVTDLSTGRQANAAIVVTKTAPTQVVDGDLPWTGTAAISMLALSAALLLGGTITLRARRRNVATTIGS